MKEEKLKLELERVKIKNKWFQTLSKEQKAVQIAKDVIQSIFEERIVAEAGTYVDSENITLSSLSNEEELQHIFLIQESCKCCALGACFVELVSLEDNCTAEGLNGYNSKTVQSKLRNKLSNIFDPFDISLIETAFEEQLILMDDDDTVFKDEEYDLIDIATKYRVANNIYSDAEALVHIMCNIIVHNGRFNPEWIYTENIEKFANQLTA